MKKPIVFIVLSTLFLFGSCQKWTEDQTQDISLNSKYIEGTWKAENGPWQITIDKHGKIVAAFILICAEELYPNKITYSEMIDGSMGSFVSGDFVLLYDKTKNYMEAVLEIKNFEMHNNDDYVKGKSKILFAGHLSESHDTWNTERVEISDYGPRFPIDANNIEPIKTVFVKVNSHNTK